jgi:hypothetical protein
MDVLLDAWDTKPDNRIRRTSPTSTTDALEELLADEARPDRRSLRVAFVLDLQHMRKDPK